MTEEYPFISFFPGYRQTLTIDLCIDLAALLILSLLIIQYIRRKHRTFELTLFFRMCLGTALMVLFSVTFDTVPILWTVNEDNVTFLILTRYLVGWAIDQFFSVILLAQWLLYVEHALHQSRDLIRRRYRIAMIPLFAAVVMLLLIIPLLFWGGGSYSGKYMPIYSGISYVVIALYVILALYIIAAYVILYREKKRNRIPAYIRLTPTTLCIVAGFAARLCFENYPCLPLFFALGLLFADYYMYRRLNHIDPKTGLLNSSYLPALISYAKKKQLTGATVIRFRVPRANDLMAKILKAWEPDLCKTVSMGDGLFLLVSAPVKDSVAERFIHFLTEQAKNEGLPVDANYETDREAPLDELLRKYI